MSFVVNQFEANTGDRTGKAFELTDTTGTVRAEVWPMWGFNCLRWQVRQSDGGWGDILYAAPDWQTDPVPTRSGNPILFPFPGRLRDGRMTWNGKTYQLPLNDSTKHHTIHGFTPRNPWRVAGVGSNDDAAWIGGAFSLKEDLPEAVGEWPSDFSLGVKYHLYRDRLTIESIVENRGSGSLPFGLGFHPYFRLPGVPDADINGHILQAHVDQVWEADASNLPTGVRLTVPPDLDFRTPRPIGETALDHVFTGVTTKPPTDTALRELAVLSHPQATGRVRILADTSFRELVLFTPPHRQAVAIEPYTCSANAADLAARGFDSGWRSLDPGAVWKARVEYHWEPGHFGPS
jgi:aldose 1-epimerase